MCIEAKQLVEEYIPGYLLHGFYPSGANAVEIAIKMAMNTTQRSRVISFHQSMHGKTLFANQLGFASHVDDNHQVIRLPFIGELDEEAVLAACKNHMATGNVAAVIVEPIQMSGGGHRASNKFYQQLESLAIDYDVMQIYDEILTGFYRAGVPFLCHRMGIKPDIVLAGKAMGSGHPVAAILHKQTFQLSQSLRAGGTYFNHPMACASVIATLNAYQQLHIEAQIDKIEQCIRTQLPGECLSGSGALWNIDLGTKENADKTVEQLFAHKIIVSFYQHYIRFLPSFQVDLNQLIEACRIVRKRL